MQFTNYQGRDGALRQATEKDGDLPRSLRPPDGTPPRGFPAAPKICQRRNPGFWLKTIDFRWRVFNQMSLAGKRLKARKKACITVQHFIK
jgi:hypothetical protein